VNEFGKVQKFLFAEHTEEKFIAQGARDGGEDFSVRANRLLESENSRPARAE
jgi:hypothetical protein